MSAGSMNAGIMEVLNGCATLALYAFAVFAGVIAVVSIVSAFSGSIRKRRFYGR